MDDLYFGVTITVLGMGIVFGLLALLWGALALLARLDSALPAAAGEGTTGEAADARAPESAVVVDAGDLEPEAIAAIALAVRAHASLQRRQAAPGKRSAKPGSQIYASRWLAAGRTRQTRSFNRGR